MSSNKNEVFEYLIDQLRQQVNKKDVTSFNVSVRVSDLDEVKQVIHNLQQHIAGRDDEIRVLKDTLRQQVNNNQCEDLAHEVLSLKSELARYKKPYIVYVKKTDWVQGDSRFLKKWGKHRADILRECIQEQDAEIQSLKNRLRDASAQIKELHIALATATGDVEAYKLIRKSKCVPEQSGCRKEDAHECEHDWVLDEKGDYFVCAKCGEQEAELVDCRHTNTVGLRKGFAPGFTKKCLDCGAKLR